MHLRRERYSRSAIGFGSSVIPFFPLGSAGFYRLHLRSRYPLHEKNPDHLTLLNQAAV